MGTNSNAPSRSGATGLRSVGPWLRSKLRDLRSAWRAAGSVRAEDWNKAGVVTRRNGLGGYVEGVSTLFQRLRWDVALRRALLAALVPALFGLPFLLAIVFVLLLLWALSPR